MTEINSSAHVVVLKGGWSSEREVSLVSGSECAGALRRRGYRVTEIDVGQDIGFVLPEITPDVAFNALHGTWGEDGCIQGILEILQIPYTHSGVLSSALAMDKWVSKAMFRRAGLPCPDAKMADRDVAFEEHVIEPPYVIKPVSDGSSYGVVIVPAGANRPDTPSDDILSGMGEKVLVEQFVPGRELTVSVMGDRPLAVTEIVPKSDFYDYASKYEIGGSDHILPADAPKKITELAMDYALRAHVTLGCRGLTRADFRYDEEAAEDKQLMLLEINTQPGMTPTSLSPEQASHVGIPFDDLVEWILKDASCRR